MVCVFFSLLIDQAKEEKNIRWIFEYDWRFYWFSIKADNICFTYGVIVGLLLLTNFDHFHFCISALRLLHDFVEDHWHSIQWVLKNLHLISLQWVKLTTHSCASFDVIRFPVKRVFLFQTKVKCYFFPLNIKMFSNIWSNWFGNIWTFGNKTFTYHFYFSFILIKRKKNLEYIVFYKKNLLFLQKDESFVIRIKKRKKWMMKKNQYSHWSATKT